MLFSTTMGATYGGGKKAPFDVYYENKKEKKRKTLFHIKLNLMKKHISR